MKEYYSFQEAHGWNKGIVKKSNLECCPTIDRSVDKQHILLIEGIKMTNEIMQVGSIANQITSTRDNPQRYRVYLVGGVSPALNCMQGGGLQPFIVDRKKKFRGGWKLMCSTTTETTPAFTHFHKNYYPTIKANSHDVGIVEYRNN